MKRAALVLAVAFAGLLFHRGSRAADARPRVFLGTITDTECGASHARMIARGGMGKTDPDCTRACIRRGATYGVLIGRAKRFYQLDDQEKPAPFAGRRVKIVGRLEGDTVYVERIVGEGSGF